MIGGLKSDVSLGNSNRGQPARSTTQRNSKFMKHKLSLPSFTSYQEMHHRLIPLRRYLRLSDRNLVSRRPEAFLLRDNENPPRTSLCSQKGRRCLCRHVVQIYLYSEKNSSTPTRHCVIIGIHESNSGSIEFHTHRIPHRVQRPGRHELNNQLIARCTKRSAVFSKHYMLPTGLTSYQLN